MSLIVVRIFGNAQGQSERGSLSTVNDSGNGADEPDSTTHEDAQNDLPDREIGHELLDIAADDDDDDGTNLQLAKSSGN